MLENVTVLDSETYPAELFNKTFIDNEGNVWEFVERTESVFFGLLKQKKIELVKTGCWSVDLEQTLQIGAKAGLARWRENTAVRELLALARGGETFVDQCITSGEQNFRKELLAGIGVQGERLLQTFVKEKFREVVDIVKEEEKNKEAVGFTSNGPFPAQTRFHWEFKTQKHTYAVYCLEMPPQRRTITIFDEKRYLAFPWVYFLVYFVDGKLYQSDRFVGEDHGMSSLGVFYRKSEITRCDDILHLSNLPQVDVRSPFLTCLGGGCPPVELSNPHWDQALLSWFWDSSFYIPHGSNHWTIRGYVKTMEAIPDTKINQWATISKSLFRIFLI